MKTLDDLYKAVAAFFESGHGPCTEGGNAPAMSLLEIACLGKPELTLQGELLLHLRCQGFNVVQEAGSYFTSPDRMLRRNLDLLVFDSFGHNKTMLCNIELKHYSANQGNANALAGALDEDNDCYSRTAQNLRNSSAQVPLPLMQVGMFTTITEIAPRKSLTTRAESIYRFLRHVDANCKVPPTPKNSNFGSVFINSEFSEKFSNPTTTTSGPSNFQTIYGESVSGQIECFIGIRSQARDYA